MVDLGSFRTMVRPTPFKVAGLTRWQVWCSVCGNLRKPQSSYEPEDPKILETRDKHRAWHEEIDK